MKALVPVITFAVRHFLIVPIAILAGWILWTIVYVILLAIAVAWNKGVGGPLAYPAGIFSIAVAVAIVGWGMFAPACALGALSCGIFRLPRLAAIPVVFGSGFLISYLLYWAFIDVLTTHPMPSAWIVLKNYVIFLAVPLGAYWWLTEGPGALFDVFRRWIGNRRRDTNNSGQGGGDDALDPPSHPSTALPKSRANP